MEKQLTPQAQHLWAKTKMKIWPEQYWLIALPFSEVGFVGDMIKKAAQYSPSFVSLIRDHQEITVTVMEEVWKQFEAETQHRNQMGPFRAISFDLPLEIEDIGYLAPAAVRLAEAGVSIIPQGAFSFDHLLVQSKDLDKAQSTLQTLIEEAQKN